MRLWLVRSGGANVRQNWSRGHGQEQNTRSLRKRRRSLHEENDSGGDGELDGPRFCGGLVSERIAGFRTARLVLRAVESGGSELELLRDSQVKTGGELEPPNAGRFYFRRETS